MTTVREREKSEARWFMAPTDPSGRINSFSLAQLLEQIRRAHCPCLILDLRAARIMRLYDIKLLVQAREVLRERRGRLRVVARAGSEVSRLLKQHQLEHLFFVCESLDEAWTSPAGGDAPA